jgi:predicted acyl esterase
LLVILILCFVFLRQDSFSKKTSDYLTLSDGTRLAYDLFLPATDGVPADGPFPTLFKYTPYSRTWTVFDENGDFQFDIPTAPWYNELAARIRKVLIPLIIPDANGGTMDTVSRTAWIGDMLKSGYAVVVVDRPGTGASFGNPPAINDLDSIAAIPVLGLFTSLHSSA